MTVFLKHFGIFDRHRSRDRLSLKAFFGSLVHAASVAQPTRRDFCSVELGDMVRRAGVNKLHATAAQISIHIGDFRHDPNILHSVKGLDEIAHHTPLNREDEEWLVQNRITFSVSALSLFPPAFGLSHNAVHSSARTVPLKSR